MVPNPQPAMIVVGFSVADGIIWKNNMFQTTNQLSWLNPPLNGDVP